MKNPSVKLNVLANFAGKGWISIIQILFIPLYIRWLGIESYALIGVFASLVAILSILDMGLGATINRELARYSAHQDTAQESRDLVRTLEFIYWGMGIVIGVSIMGMAPLLARYWIQSDRIPAEVIEQSFMIMGLILAVQWPTSLYSGGLMGLQQQVLLNWVRAFLATLQSGGAVLLLWLVSPSILVFFYWQAATALLGTLVLAFSLWRFLPQSGHKPTFSQSLLRKNWRFAAGITGISIVAIILTQSDKIILSKMLTLQAFGYYTLAVNISSALGVITGSFSLAIFPRFSQLVAIHNLSELSDLYHKVCQSVSILIFPAAFTLAVFSQEILTFWIRDTQVAQNTHQLLSVIAIGTALNAIMTPPYTLQLAHGWTRLSFLKNVVAIVILIPALFWATMHFGAMGAAAIWVILNAGYFFIEIPIMHNVILHQEKWRWYFQDIGIPFLVSVGILLSIRSFIPRDGTLTTLLLIGLSGLLSLSITAISRPFVRKSLKQSLHI